MLRTATRFHGRLHSVTLKHQRLDARRYQRSFSSALTHEELEKGINTLQSGQARLKILRAVPVDSLSNILQDSSVTSTKLVNVARSMAVQRIESIPDPTGSSSLTALDILTLAVEKDPTNSVAFSHLGHLLPQGETVTISGKQYSPRDLLLKAIDLWPQNSAAHWQLSRTLSSGESVSLLDGRLMNQHQLCMKSVHLDPTDPVALAECANTTPYDWSIRLANGAPANKESLLIKSIELDPLYTSAYVKLVECLQHERKQSVTFSDGKTMTVLDLGLKAVENDPQNPVVWNLLASLLENPTDTTELLNRERLNRRALLLRAIACDPTYGDSYLNLALTLNDENEKVTLPKAESKPVTKHDLLLESIRYNPKSALGYYYLAIGDLAKAGTPITLLDGSTLTPKELLLKAIDLMPENSTLYNALADYVVSDGKIRLLNGREMSYSKLKDRAAARFNAAKSASDWSRMAGVIGIAAIAVGLIFEGFGQ